MQKLRRISTANAELDRVQVSIADSYDSLVDVPLNSGQLIGPVTIGTTATLISHRLGREFRGWIPVRRLANAAIWENQTQPAPSAAISLLASSPVTVTLFVF